jgi:hypothetical protein
MLKIIRNTTALNIFIADTGIEVPAFGQYTIRPEDYQLWIPSEDVVGFIVAGDIVVNDGEDDLTNKRIAIGLIQDNQMVVSEHYTLVEEDDVLVGNGQILYLNDEFDTTNNVPDYIDEQIEDDDPTES